MNVMMLCPLFCDWGYHGLYAGLRTGETAKHKCAIPSGGFRLAMPCTGEGGWENMKAQNLSQNGQRACTAPYLHPPCMHSRLSLLTQVSYMTINVTACKSTNACINACTANACIMHAQLHTPFELCIMAEEPDWMRSKLETGHWSPQSLRLARGLAEGATRTLVEDSAAPWSVDRHYARSRAARRTIAWIVAMAYKSEFLLPAEMWAYVFKFI